jgi:hypothetical protein
MLKAVDRVPIIDVYERLLPERLRVQRRVDFIAWLAACARQELCAMGVARDELSVLENVEADPDVRWGMFAAHWPFLQTTGVGRMILRVAWELYGAETIDERTWKDISTHLWQEAQTGFYRQVLHDRANLRTVLVDSGVERNTEACCVPVHSYDSLLSLGCRSEVEGWGHALDRSAALTFAGLDALIERSIQLRVGIECACFKLGTLATIDVPSDEEAEWAFERVLRREGPDAEAEPDLQSYVLHRLLSCISDVQVPVQVHVDDSAEVTLLGAYARRYPRVRFVGVCRDVHTAQPLCALARRAANVNLALAGAWYRAPHVARRVLRDWISTVPLNKIFAVAGELTMVESVCVQALIVREQVALLLAERVAEGELNEQEAILVMDRVLYKNALTYFGLT